MRKLAILLLFGIALAGCGMNRDDTPQPMTDGKAEMVETPLNREVLE